MRILFPFLGSDLSSRALEAALRLAAAEEATLVPAYLARVPLNLPLESPLPTAVRAGDPDHGGDRAAGREVGRRRWTAGSSGGGPTATPCGCCWTASASTASSPPAPGAARTASRPRTSPGCWTTPRARSSSSAPGTPSGERGARTAPRLGRVNSDEIRRTYLDFFEQRGHKIVPSASLVPASHDPSVLLTTAGMQPFKRAFLGQEEPPAKRVADVQRCFRTTDIEEVGNTARHLTFFEMLGNWSFGDYFKEQSIPWGWELSIEGFGFDPELIWVTVFEGDEELGLGPDEESIEIWRSVGVPDERIVQLPRVGELLAGRADRALRPLHRALLRPRRGVRRRRRPPRRRHRPLRRVLEPRLHDLRPGRGRVAQPAAAEQRRHRHGGGADGGDPAGRPLGVRDRRAVAAGGAGRGPLGPRLRRRRRDHPRRCGSWPTTRAARRR